MPEDIELKLLDKRVVARYLAKGRLDEKDYEKHLKSLPDLAERAVPIESDLEAMELDEDDEELEEPGQQEAAAQAQPSPQAAPQEPSPQVAAQAEPSASQGSEPAQPPAPPAPEPQGS